MSFTTKTPGHKEEKRQLPDGWRWVRLGELIREAKAGFACGERDADGIAQLRMNNLDTRGTFVWGNVIRVPRGGNNIKPFLLVPGDVLFNNTNSTELVGKSALFAGYAEPIVYSNHFTRLRTISDALLPDVLASWLNHQWQQGVFTAICRRWIGQSAVKTDKLLNLEMPLPPLWEQQRIAGALKEQMATVEKARAAAHARLEAVKALPAAFLRQVFPQPGQPLPDAWRWVRLGEVCLFRRGPFGGSLKKEIFVKSGYAVYEQSHAITNDFSAFRYFIDEEKFRDMRGFQVNAGDLIMSCSGTMGKTAIIPEDAPPGVINQALLKLTPTDRTSSTFLKLWMESASFQQSLGDFTYGAAIRNVGSIRILKELRVPLPPSAEQRRIAAALKEQMVAVEKARAAAEEELNTINALPAALLRRAFNGEL